MATIRLRVDRKLEVYELPHLYTQVKNNTCELLLTTSQVKRILQLGAKWEKTQADPQKAKPVDSIPVKSINKPVNPESPKSAKSIGLIEIPDQGISPEYIKSLFAESNVN